LGVIGWFLQQIFWDNLFYTCALVTAFVVACIIFHALKDQVERDKFFRGALLNLAFLIESILEIRKFSSSIGKVLAHGAFNSGPKFFLDCVCWSLSALKMLVSFCAMVAMLVIWFFRFVYLGFGSLWSTDIKLPDERGSLNIPESSRKYISWLLPETSAVVEPSLQPEVNPLPQPEVNPAPQSESNTFAPFYMPSPIGLFKFNAPARAPTAGPVPQSQSAPASSAGTVPQPAPASNAGTVPQPAPGPVPNDMGAGQPAPSPAQEKFVTFFVTSKDGQKRRKIECTASQLSTVMDALGEEFNS
jgi:hypothetical protein